jgi:ABC-type molybdate transport system substrate-binding protein
VKSIPAVAGLVVLALAVCAEMPTRAQDEGLVLYGAGSLREAMTEMAAAFTRRHGIAVRTQFAASGRMRERIEAGERVDVFASADIGHAAKLVADGRASVMAMFARNDLCLLVPAARSAASSAGVVDALMKDGVRTGVSPARIDPLGDYTMQLFDLIERQRPGSGQSLRSRAVTLDNPPGAPAPQSGDYYLDALRAGRVDLAIVYCSGRARFAALASDLVLTPFPADLAVGPQCGLAVMDKARPGATPLALTILSPEGQKILAAAGFQPVTLPGASR